MYLRYADEEVIVSSTEKLENFDEMDLVRVFVLRERIDESKLERGQTRIYVVEATGDSDSDARFGGVLRDINRKGSLTELIVESTERFAKNAIPTTGGEEWNGVTDSTIVKDAISNVSQLSEGTIDTLTTSTSMVFSHTSQANKIRQVGESVGAEIRYNPDGSVDYLARRGSDKTNITIGPDSQNVKDSFNAEKKSGDEIITHLRVLGAGEGNHQTQVNLIPQSDSTDYESMDGIQNVIRYDASHWESGDKIDWDVHTNVDHNDVDSLQDYGETLIEDVQQESIDVRTTIEGVEVELGDTFHVYHEEEDIDADLRVVELTERVDATGTHYSVVLSTRKDSRFSTDAKTQADVEREKTSLQGSPVMINTSAGRQPVNVDHDYVMKLYYPRETKYVHRLSVRVMGLPYRAYSAGAKIEGGDHSHDSDIPFSDLAHTHTFSGINVTLGNSERNQSLSRTSIEMIDSTPATTPASATFNLLDSGVLDCLFTVVGTLGGSNSDVDITTTVTDVDPNSSTTAQIGTTTTTIDAGQTFYTTVYVEREERDYSSIEVSVQAGVDGSEQDMKNLKAFITTRGDHSHSADASSGETDETGFADQTVSTTENAGNPDAPPNPGIIEDFNETFYYPQNISVLVNGTQVSSSNITFQSRSDDGSGEFIAVADIEADDVSLQEGTVNTIKVTSDTLGHVLAFVEGDVYRQINGGG